MHIWLTDNNGNNPKRLREIQCEDREAVLKELHKIADVNILELKKNSNLLVFSNKDKIEDTHVFSIVNNGEDSEIVTGNIAGFVGINDVQISIQSRFSEQVDNGDENQERNDYFLHYMLSKVFNINLLDFKHGEEKGSVFDFLVFLFPSFLNRALKKGIVRTYVRNEYNDSNIKGPLNVSRFLKEDIPFIGRVAYDKREYSADNSLTELVRHTIEYIRSGNYSSIVRDGDVASDVRKIIEVTPSYDRSVRESVINRNLRPIRHPYYSEWTDLQRICLMILRHNKLNYAESKDKIYGIVFDVAWLWEEYLNTLLRPLGYTHPRNKTGEGKIFLFENETGETGTRYPDFYNEYCVLDAKYKRFEYKGNVSSIDRDDLHQMITYMYVLKKHPENGVFLFPVKNETFSHVKPLKLNGYGGWIKAEGHLIPQGTHSFKEFSKQMEENAEDFSKRIRALNDQL